MKLGFFTMPVHRLDRDYTEVLQKVMPEINKSIGRPEAAG